MSQNRDRAGTSGGASQGYATWPGAGASPLGYQASPGYQQPVGQGYQASQGYAAWPGTQPSQGYQASQGYQQPAGQGYQSSQGYQFAQSYQQPAQQGYQASQGFQASPQGYQTPQVTGGQQPVSSWQSPYAQQGYAQQGAYTGAQSYSAAPQGYAQQPQQPTGSSWPGYPGQQPAPGQAQGSYIPQTPYSPGYTASGYANPAQQAGAAYTPYAQMGRGQQIPVSAQLTQGQAPLNGGGYVPQPVPVRRQPFSLRDTDLILLGAILVILFAVGMFIPGLRVLRWIFLALALGSAALLWLRPMVASTKRLTFTIVFGILAAVTVVSLFTGASGAGQPAGGDRTRVSSAAAAAQAGTATEAPQTAVTQQPAAGTATPEPQDDSSVTDRLETFFFYWSANRQEEMLTLCAPSWQGKQENPKPALFALLANRTPKDYAVENVSGTPYDTSRTVTVTSLMDRNNGKPATRYRLSVIMVKENELWYVDPQSLQTYESAETTDPSITPTPGPTATPATYPNTVLYYNPSGGEYYHRDQNCKRINERYLPLKGHFTYAELNKEPYNKLKPCAICGAPSAGQ